MKDQDEFGATPSQDRTPAGSPLGQLDCAAVEMLWAEAAEGTLGSSLAEQVQVHTAICASCREKISQVRSGREWLLVLKQEPLQPPADMVAKILAKTTGAQEAAPLPKPGTLEVSATVRMSHSDSDVPLGHSGDNFDVRAAGENSGNDYEHGHNKVPYVSSPAVWQHTSVVWLRKTVLDPRLALVAAMAFFSISLTLNLVGVRVTRLRAADLEPQAMRRAVTRQYAEANASVVRYYENLRIVYEVESQVRQLRQAAESSPKSGQTSNKPGKRSPGSSRNSSDDQTEPHRDGMTANSEMRGNRRAVLPDPKPVMTGPLMDTAFHSQALPTLQYTSRHTPRASSFLFSSTYFSMRRFSTRERRLA